MDRVIRLFNIYGRTNGSSFAGNVYDTGGVSPTLNTCEGGNRQPLIVADMTKDITLKQYPHGYNDGFEYKDVCPTITISSFEHNNFIIEKDMERESQITLPKELEGKKFRIRKLTPKECFRLMGVDDTDIDKLIEAREVDDAVKQMQNEHTSVKRVLSNSSLYKLAGNSIVVDVLYHIFRKMFIATENESGQLTLF